MNKRFRIFLCAIEKDNSGIEHRKIAVRDTELRNTVFFTCQRHEGVDWYAFRCLEKFFLAYDGIEEQSAKEFIKVFRKAHKGSYVVMDTLRSNFDTNEECEFLSFKKWLDGVRN